LLLLTCFVANIRCSWYQWIQNCQVHHFLTGLHMNSHFWENGRWITINKKIDFVFLRFFEIVIWRPMLTFCRLEDNRITYPKSIGSLSLCYTDAEISTREVTPWPCNNFAGQCRWVGMLEVYSIYNYDNFHYMCYKSHISCTRDEIVLQSFQFLYEMDFPAEGEKEKENGTGTETAPICWDGIRENVCLCNIRYSNKLFFERVFIKIIAENFNFYEWIVSGLHMKNWTKETCSN
jgi:hypothetical protein